jgi:hypothetical protein
VPTKQKLLLSISLLTLILPELLWSPILNMVYSLTNYSNNGYLPRPSFIFEQTNNIMVILVLLLQFLGGLFILVISLKNLNKDGHINFVFLTVAILVSIVVLLLIACLYALFATYGIGA